jgi:hypothetical protein
VGEAGAALDGRVDDGVKDGLRSPAIPGEPEESAEPDGLGDAAESDGPVFVEREANQLFVAAIACLTAWRPLSSTPLPDPGVSPRSSSSFF